MTQHTLFLFLTHQRIQLVPPADKESSIYAECRENGNVVGLEDDFLCSTGTQRKLMLKF